MNEMDKFRQSTIEAITGINTMLAWTDLDARIKENLGDIREHIIKAYGSKHADDETLAHKYMQSAIQGILANPSASFGKDGEGDFGFGIIAACARKVTMACLEQDTELIAQLRARKYTLNDKINELSNNDDSSVMPEPDEPKPVPVTVSINDCPLCKAGKMVEHPNKITMLKCNACKHEANRFDAGEQ